MSQTTPAPAADDEIDLGRLIGLLFDHKWWIVGITALFTLAGVVYALLATPIYQSDSLVQVESKAGLRNPLDDARSLLGEDTRSDTELQILRSRLVLGRAVDQERLDIVVEPRRFPVVGDFLVRRGMERPDFAERSIWAGESINVAAFEVEPHLLGNTFIVTAGEGDQYQLALEGEPLGQGQVGEDATFLNGQVRLRVAELNTSAGAEFSVVRRSRLSAINQLRSRFNVSEQGRDSGVFNLTLTDTNPRRAERTLNAISQIYLTQNVQRQSAEAEQSLTFLEGQAPEMLSQLREAEDELNAYRMQRDSVDLSLETQALLERIVNLEAQLNELEFTEAEVSRRYTPSHPTYAALLEKRQQLERERGELNARVNDLPETQQQILRMSRDVEVNQQIYIQLLNKMQEMDIARASTVGNVRILDEAVVQPNPIEPKKPLIVVLATLLGGMLAVGGVLVRGLLRRGVESPEQIEQVGLPVYATVPLSDEQSKLVKRIKRKRDTQGQNVSFGVLAQRAPGDTSIEALRGLRTSLHFAMMESDNNRLVITGPSPAVGKSFISVNLGAVCASSGQRVLIVDADMRKGHIHSAFGGKSEGGLSDILAGKQNLQGMARTTATEGLNYIARGAAPPNPSELLMTERFSQFLDEASQIYDLVIIDTPPILAVTDAAIVGKQCGTTLMVARFMLNPVKELELAKRRLETSGVIVKGSILNAMERKAATSYGYGYYNYSYK